MQLLPYTGKQHTFTTQLPIDECRRRLRDDVQQLSRVQDYFMGNYWAPLAIDNGVVRLIDGEWFELRTKPPSRNEITWMFEGRFEVVADQTTIIAQYRLSRAGKFGLYTRLVMPLIAITVLAYRTFTQGVSLETLWIGVFAVLLIASVLVTLRRNEEKPYEEAHLVRTLQQLFDAEELSASSV